MLIKIWIDSILPLEGRAQTGDNGAVGFAGWLELLAILIEGVEGERTESSEAATNP